MIWLVGGRQARSASVWDSDHRALYDAGVLLGLAPDGTVPVTRVTPDVRCLKGVSWHDDGVLTCSETAVVAFDPRTHRFAAPIPVPGGDDLDLHHVVDHDGRTCIAVTGRDEVWIDDTVVHVGDDRGRAHPNHLWAAAGGLWVTRGALGDVRSVATGRTLPIADVVIHDGVVRPEGVWFTTVDGRLVLLDPVTGERRTTLDLLRFEDRDAPLGWCRGLAFGDGWCWVGFTRLRATRTRQRLAWARGALRGRPMATHHPTRVVAYDLAAGRKVAEVDVERFGMHAVFGIVPDISAPGERAERG